MTYVSSPTSMCHGAAKPACNLRVLASLARTKLRSFSLIILGWGVAAAPSVTTGIDSECWTPTFFSEMCCTGKGGEIGCWDSEYTFERCCGGNDERPKGYKEWLAQPLPEVGDEHYHFCAEYVRRFDFAEENAVLHDRFNQCVRNRLKSARGAFRPAALAGQHFPTLLAPGPDGLVFALPAYDFVVSKQVKTTGTYDHEELNLYRQLLPVGGTMLDVGANIGAYAVPLALHVGRTGLVVAVEPFQVIFQMLTANSAINGMRNLRTRQVGLGAVEERVLARGPTLEKMNNVGMSRVFRAFEEKHAETFMFGYADEEETIHVTTLDKLVESEGLQSVSVLKVDAEGHLKAVLAGGQATLRNMRPAVVAEYSEDDALSLLEREHGYECRELLPKHETWVCLPDGMAWDSLSPPT